ncbi:MAG TPA: ABC transporter substrate-binding protein [Rhodopila sp.]|uniref:ABC transporter substrate-binding protein n=1 Tax=Rhodopila sp. TaxID=2480087 RepID=UPI002BBB95A5|nr:ABC transporter substrate-binding protein [Rhodopila sp.]HVY16823.1 ABC transporter substrate-binding protein [Rhodopila sp.]
MQHLYRRSVLAGSLAFVAAARQAGAEAPVKVGVLTDMTGVYSDSIGPGSVVAAQLAAEDVGGKVLGRPIEILSADNQNKADIGSAIARQWYDRDGVGLIVGLDNSAVALAVERDARDRNGVVIAIAVSTNDFTGKNCAPTAMSWNYDSYALTHGVARTLVARGLDTWFFISVDFAFGVALETSASQAVRQAGGKVLGSVKHPIDAGDFSSFLIAAKASGAKVIALANGGGDMTNAVKQANEFGIVQGGQTMVPLLCNIADVHSLGLQVAQGITLMTAFSWNRTEESRAWSKRFFARRQRMPTMSQAATYSATLHYLRAVAAAGTTDSLAVVAKMKAMPIHDMFAAHGTIRADGRMLHDMYLVRIKTPAESKGPWDYEQVLQTVPGDVAFQPVNEVGCPLVGKT